MSGRRHDASRTGCRPARVLCLAAVLSLAPGVGAETACPLRMVEPPLLTLAEAARSADDAALAEARAAADVDVRRLAIVISWYRARGSADTERRTRATSDLFEIWQEHRVAARLMRVVGAGLAEEGWPAPTREAVERRLSRMGDRTSVLARARAVALAEDVSRATLIEALQGVRRMAIVHDGEALAVAGMLLRRIDEPYAAAETVLFRAELGEPAALAELADAYAGLSGCDARAALVRALVRAPSGAGGATSDGASRASWQVGRRPETP